jgi:hypothetical protein
MSQSWERTNTSPADVAFFFTTFTVQVSQRATQAHTYATNRPTISDPSILIPNSSHPKPPTIELHLVNMCTTYGYKQCPEANCHYKFTKTFLAQCPDAFPGYDWSVKCVRDPESVETVEGERKPGKMKYVGLEPQRPLHDHDNEKPLYQAAAKYARDHGITVSGGST